MQIEQSNVLLESRRDYAQKHSLQEKLTVWVGDETNAAETTATGEGESPVQGAVFVSLSQQAQAAMQTAVAQRAAQPQPGLESVAAKMEADKNQALQKMSDAVDELMGDPELMMLKYLIEKIYGEELRAFASDPCENAEADCAKMQSTAVQTEAPQVAWGLEYERVETYHETEQTQFSAEGTIQTADGQSIAFTLEVQMSREFKAENYANLRMGQGTQDPLVVNFGGNAAQLTDRTFAFDLTANGQVEQIAFVKPGSGFLALDRNGDGKINNGSELFGPESGNGFADLRAFDLDGNDWIDENDAVFESLRVWHKDSQGGDHLDSLASRGIGAIYLQSVKSEFSVKDTQNELLGQVRSSGVFVKEDGSVGSVQQVDLAI